MNPKRKRRYGGGVLITVLFVIMAITVISLGLFARTDMNLACGKNLSVRMQMDTLAYNGLEHARALLINPQGVDTSAVGYWQGQAGLQIEAGSDYYDLTITQAAAGLTKRCSYTIQCQAYRIVNTERIAQSNLEAEFRLHPAVAYWQGVQWSLPAEVAVYGDIYYNDQCTIFGSVCGDVYSSGSILNSGSVGGQLYPDQTNPVVTSPGLSTADFSGAYYIDSTSYMTGSITPGTVTNQTYNPGGANPAGIYYCGGSLTLAGNCQVNGTLVVLNDLFIANGATVTINAGKNFPALLVGNSIEFQGNAALNVYGLAQVNQAVYFHGPGCNGNSMNVQGCLVVVAGGLHDTAGNSVTITLDPALGAIQTWPSAGNAFRWTPAGGGFFKGINRL